MLKNLKNKTIKNENLKLTYYKVLSVLFALIFWVFVIDKVNPEIEKTYKDIPVEVVGIEKLRLNNYELIEKEEKNIDITLKGKRTIILDTDVDDIKLFYNVAKLKEGKQDIKIEADIKMNGVYVTDMSENKIDVQIDKIVREPIPLRVLPVGKVPEDYILEEVKLSVENIFIKGPKTYVDQVAFLSGNINIKNETKNLTKDILLVPVDEQSEVIPKIELEDDYVSVDVLINKVKDIDIEAVIKNSVDENYEVVNIDVTPKKMKVKGDREKINSIKFIETTPIDMKGVTKSLSVSSELNLPDDIYLIGESKRVKVNVEVQKIITKEFTYEPKDVKIINVPLNLRSNIKDLSGIIILKISAREDILKDKTKEDFSLYIDASEFKKGKISGDILLNYSGSTYKHIEISPSSLKLEITEN